MNSDGVVAGSALLLDFSSASIIDKSLNDILGDDTNLFVNSGYLFNGYVHPDYRRMGHAKWCIREAERRAGELTWDFLTVTVKSGDVTSDLFSHLGWALWRSHGDLNFLVKQIPK